jgi:hypothetical protein
MYRYSYPRNLQPTGPTSKTRAANASPSFNGGGIVNFSRLTKRHVILVGILARFGGIITRTPECRQPRIAPPRASTKKLTKNLCIQINI